MPFACENCIFLTGVMVGKKLISESQKLNRFFCSQLSSMEHIRTKQSCSGCLDRNGSDGENLKKWFCLEPLHLREVTLISSITLALRSLPPTWGYADMRIMHYRVFVLTVFPNIINCVCINSAYSSKYMLSTKKLSLLIPKELHHKLKKHALDTDTTVTAILIHLINTYVPDQTK